MKAKFVMCINLEDRSEHASFGEAFKAFFDGIMEMMRNGGTSWQALETACWIEGVFEVGNGVEVRGPLMFPDARDFAIEEGILIRVNGKSSIADPLPNIPMETVFLRYKMADRQTVEGMLRQLEGLVDEMVTLP
jgi:hypothetical protein